MALFGLFGGKRKGYATPWMQLTVVYATAPEGLQPDDAFALRGKILTAQTIYFEFLDRCEFLACYPGTAAGLEAGTRLAGELRGIARAKAVPSFGVGVYQGECLAQMKAGGRLAGKPAGLAISQAIELASQEATARGH